MSGMEIRKARAGDVGDILRLIRELAAFEHGLNQVTMTEEELLRDGFGKDPLFQCIVAERDGVIAGMALYFFTYSTWNGKCLYLEDLIVSSKDRYGGLGSGLMEEIIRIAHREGAKRLSWQVLAWNLDAQEFYRNFGASLDNEWLNGRMDEVQIGNFGKQ